MIPGHLLATSSQVRELAVVSLPSRVREQQGKKMTNGGDKPPGLSLNHDPFTVFVDEILFPFSVHFRYEESISS